MGFIRKKRYLFRKGSLKRNIKQALGFKFPKDSGAFFHPKQYLKRRMYEATTISQDKFFSRKKNKSNKVKPKRKKWIIAIALIILWIIGLLMK